MAGLSSVVSGCRRRRGARRLRGDTVSRVTGTSVLGIGTAVIAAVVGRLASWTARTSNPRCLGMQLFGDGCGRKHRASAFADGPPDERDRGKTRRHCDNRKDEPQASRTPTFHYRSLSYPDPDKGQGTPKANLKSLVPARFSARTPSDDRQKPALLATLRHVVQVLVVEDDASIRAALVRALGERGHAVSSANDALSGLRSAVDDRPDLVLLDLGLPDLDGAEVLRMLRAVSAVPVIVATARDDDASIVRALDAGADDYLTKPFSAEQLDARIRAVLRRSSDTTATTELRVGQLMVDTGSREASLNGASIELSPKEFDLLAYLMARVGNVVSKRELLTEVWRLPYGGADKTVDVHLSWLRRKLGETAQEPRFLVSVRGVGIKVVDPTAN